MIDIKQQEEILIAIGNALTKKISVYAIGGTAMMLLGIKNSTLDIDLVFNKTAERQTFINALKKLGAKEFDATLLYGLKDNTPIMLEFKECRFDMFMNKIITSYFSENMQKRATQIHEFGNLIVRTADVADLIIMKSATSRLKDLEDIIAIVNNGDVDWNVVLEESKDQVKLGNETAIMNLGEKLEKLDNQRVISLPKDFLDNLWKLFKKQVGRRAKKR